MMPTVVSFHFSLINKFFSIVMFGKRRDYIDVELR